MIETLSFPHLGKHLRATSYCQFETFTIQESNASIITDLEVTAPVHENLRQGNVIDFTLALFVGGPGEILVEIITMQPQIHVHCSTFFQKNHPISLLNT